MLHLPVVAIIGRPNVGKSSLFNRFLGKGKAIISDIPGTTRDMVDAVISKKKQMPFYLVDTAGIMELETEDDAQKELEVEVQKQVRYAIDEADVLMFVVDVTDDILSTDQEVAQLLRKSGKPYVFVANKCDNEKMEVLAASFYSLGLGEPIAVSVSHKRHLDELEKQVQKVLTTMGFAKPEEDEEAALNEESRDPHIALIGTPNVGKSALFNALTGSNKAIVSAVAGTTRDAHDTVLVHENKNYVLVDTAGIRRRGKIEKGIEKYSVLRTERSIMRSDVCLLVLDAVKGIRKQDMHMAQYILEAKKGLVIVLNKWDLVKEKTDLPEELRVTGFRGDDLMELYIAYLRFKFPFLPWASVIFVSAKNGKNVHAVYEMINQSLESRVKRIETGILNRFVAMVVEQHKPSGARAFIPKVSYATQVGVNPPEFVVFVNKKEFFHFSYKRYLENKIREKYDFLGTPIGIEFRNKPKKDYKSEE